MTFLPERLTEKSINTLNFLRGLEANAREIREILQRNFAGFEMFWFLN